MADKKSFVLYDSYFNQIQFLTMEQRGELLTAILEYRIFGEITTQLSQITQVVFSFIKDTLERDKEAYKRRCDANRENGKKGGRPSKKASLFKTQKPKKADNDNDNGIDNENDNDIDIDIDIDIGIGIGNGIGNGNGNDAGFAPLSPSPSLSDGASRALSEQDKRDLIYLGLPEGYLLGERVARATIYAKENGMAVMDVLLDWWNADKRQGRKRESSRAEEEHTPKSSDTDEFFEAALRRGLEEASSS